MFIIIRERQFSAADQARSGDAGMMAQQIRAPYDGAAGVFVVLRALCRSRDGFIVVARGLNLVAIVFGPVDERARGLGEVGAERR